MLPTLKWKARRWAFQRLAIFLYLAEVEDTKFQLLSKMESTKMSFPKISNFTAIVDEFEYSTTEKVTYFFPMVIIIIFGIKIHLQLLQYLRMKTGSYVNQVIGFQTYTNLYLIPFVVIFGALRRWISDTLSPDMTLICYTYSYLAEFLTISIQNHSFFVKTR